MKTFKEFINEGTDKYKILEKQLKHLIKIGELDKDSDVEGLMQDITDEFDKDDWADRDDVTILGILKDLGYID